MSNNNGGMYCNYSANSNSNININNVNNNVNSNNLLSSILDCDFVLDIVSNFIV